jgi:hypothetical protein
MGIMSICRRAAFAASILVLLAAVFLRAQAPAAGNSPTSEQAFKNVQVLKGIPVDEFMDTMGMISASLGMNCSDCHTNDTAPGWGAFADETPTKRTARRMMQMVADLNKANFGGRPVVSCYTCHRGDHTPKVVPSLALQYSEPFLDPNDMEVFANPSGPSVDAVLDKYIAVIGGAQRVGGMTTYIGKGTYEGFDTYHGEVPVEIYAKAPNQLTTIVHASWGENIRTFDGTAGWISSSDRPVPLLELTGGTLEGARIDAVVLFPSRIKGAFSRWRVGATTIEDAEVTVLQGSNDGRPLANLYFDDQSGLLVRLVHWTVTTIGTVPTQIDFSDYREIAGIKLPFKIVTTWTNGQNTIKLTEAQLNSAIDAAKFSKPRPAPPLKVQ